MHRLNPISPLWSKKPIRKEFGPYTIEEVNSNALASYSFRKGTERDAKKNVEQFMEGSLPDIMSCKFGKISSFWIGPSQWLIEAPIDIYENLAGELAQISAGTASVTEQTDAWCRFDLMVLTWLNLSLCYVMLMYLRLKAVRLRAVKWIIWDAFLFVVI